MRTLILAIFAILAASSTPAAAQPAADRNDVRCLLVLQAVSRDPKQKEAADRGIYFFMGKIEARGGIVRLEPMLLAEGKALANAEQIRAELGRCGGELTRSTQNLQATNQRLVKAAQGAQPAPPKK